MLWRLLLKTETSSLALLWIFPAPQVVMRLVERVAPVGGPVVM